MKASTETPEGGSIEPLVAVPLYDLCDLYELALTLLGDDGFEDLGEEDKQAISGIGGRCTRALNEAFGIG